MGYSLISGFGVEISRKFTNRVLLGFLVVFLLVNHLYFTTFEKVISKKIDDETEIRSLSIDVYENGDKQASVTIDDQETMERILSDLKKLKVKKNDQDYMMSSRSFHLTFDIRNLTKLNNYLAENYRVSVSEHSVNGYKILGKPDHLKTIDELVEDGGVFGSMAARVGRLID